MLRSFKTKRVVAIGEAMIEMAPVEGGLYARGFAGDTFNTAWHMAQLLGPAASVGLFTRIGTDVLSDGFAAELAADGLDAALLQRDPERQMGLYLIARDGVERSFHYWRGQSAARGLADDPAALKAGLAGAGLIHLSGITLAILSEGARAKLLAALGAARLDGALVSFDPNLRPRLWPSLAAARAAFEALLPLTDIVLPSFDDEALLWADARPEDSLARLKAAGVAEVIVKNGVGPVCFQVGPVEGVLSPPTVADVRDTTGAGDAFNAGYLVARLKGAAPEAAIRFAQALAGEVIRHFGARAPKDRLISFAAQSF